MTIYPKYPNPQTISEWLTTHGDRGTKDLKKDDKGYFVFMSSCGKKVKVYLPPNLTK